MSAAPASAVYEGLVRHQRHGPRPHRLQYRMAQLYLDLDEVQQVFAGRWLWSVQRRNVAEFRRSDFLGPAHLPLAEAVRQRITAHTGARPAGPIRLLTHLRYFGHSFNPVSFYYCYAADAVTLEYIVAEITNTPWHERHSYVLDAAAAQRRGAGFEWSFAKAFHVSPFVAMARTYRWRLSVPGPDLNVHMAVLCDGRSELDASLVLKRRPLNAASLRRVLLRYPLMSTQVVAGIYWHALRLWLKGTPVHAHPDTISTVTAASTAKVMPP